MKILIILLTIVLCLIKFFLYKNNKESAQNTAKQKTIQFSSVFKHFKNNDVKLTKENEYETKLFDKLTLERIDLANESTNIDPKSFGKNFELLIKKMNCCLTHGN